MMNSSVPYYRPSLRSNARAAFAQLSRPEQTARLLSQLNLCHATLEQALFILPPDSTLANKMQSVVDEIRCRVLATITSDGANDPETSLQPSTQGGLSTPPPPASRKRQDNDDLALSGIEPISFNLSVENSCATPSTLTRRTELDGQQSDMTMTEPSTLPNKRQEIELASTPRSQMIPLDTWLSAPSAPRQSIKKRNQTEGVEISTSFKRQRHGASHSNQEDNDSRTHTRSMGYSTELSSMKPRE
ncbi:hypothetical protein AK830_g17 [Neonectria ditissima]|uniref:Uncharacterized protein n=1 Tax=Neonectria ditissima TaxID=78410 RepID=A0A0P7BY13_9HYPO|nr:hypothetical protein AK830_g17 [Neonectria ditissima]